MSSDRSHPEKAIGPISPTKVHTGEGVEVVRTYLGMARLDQLIDRPLPAAKPTLERVDACTVPRWRQLYADIGTPWHWHDRDAWPDEQLAEHLARPEVQVFRLVAGSSPSAPAAGAGPNAHDSIGFLELERHADASVEIVYLGLHPSAIGKGIGAWFIAAAVKQAFAHRASRVWLHTCTLDSPAALPNYVARGFTPERTETYTTRIRPS